MSNFDWLYTLSSSPDARFWDAPFSDLSIPERVFKVVWGLKGQIDNGGLWQYYFNDSGDHAHFAPEALRAIGAVSVSQIIESANALFGASGPPQQREHRQEVIEALGESAQSAWSTLDNRFFETAADLDALLATYVLTHKSEIRGV
jgi:hypothetical protein